MEAAALERGVPAGADWEATCTPCLSELLPGSVTKQNDNEFF